MRMRYSDEKSNFSSASLAGRIAHWIFGEKDPNLLFGYVNPWHAAMEDFVDHTEIKTRPRRQRRAGRKAERPENRRPALRL